MMDSLRRKLVEGTEVLRTGGGASLNSGECSLLLDLLETSKELTEVAAHTCVYPCHFHANEDGMQQKLSAALTAVRTVIGRQST